MKIPRIKRIKTKSIFIVLICFIMFFLIGTPIIENTTFGTLRPFLIDHINMKIGNSTALMSNFLYYSNVEIRSRTMKEEFQKKVYDYSQGDYSDEQFNSLISEQMEPFESTVIASETKSITSLSYPAVYVEGKGIFCSEKVKKAAEKLVASDWFADYKENRNDLRLYSPIVKTEGSESWFSYVFTNYKLQKEDTVEKVNYYVFLFTEFSDIAELCDDFFSLDIADYVFLGKDFDLLYQNLDDSELDFEWIQKHVIAADRQHYVVSFEENDDAYFSVLVSSAEEGLRFVLHSDRQDLRKLYNDNVSPVLILFFILVLVFIIIIISLLNQIFRRLTNLSKKMSVVKGGNYDVKIEDKSEDEIGQLVSVFNEMTDRIKENVNRLIEKENREKLLQYNLMVSAIDPHFIYNTLNTTTRLAELGRNQEVIEVNDALINCMKNNLKMKSLQAYDTVENEKNMLDQYIKIQNYLCDNTIKLDFEVSSQNLNLKIPKFLLQPIIENSIIHGILLNIDENGNMVAGKIRVVIKVEEGRIEILVQDNGIGMSKETIDKYFLSDEKIIFEDNASFDHIGILNLRTRLSYLYNDDYILKVESGEGKGTKIIIVIPVNGYDKK